MMLTKEERMAKMDSAGAEAEQAFKALVKGGKLPAEALAVVQGWMREHFPKAGYKRLAWVVMNHVPTLACEHCPYEAVSPSDLDAHVQHAHPTSSGA